MGMFEVEVNVTFWVHTRSASDRPQSAEIIVKEKLASLRSGLFGIVDQEIVSVQRTDQPPSRPTIAEGNEDGQEPPA